jgi:DNA-binding MarR family transcriptional regulator
MPKLGRTILLDVFASNQKRQQLIDAALAGTGLPPEDYPVYAVIGVGGPWTPTELARHMAMPLSTALFRIRRLERRGHAERIPHPDDGRSFLVRLTPKGNRLFRRVRPLFREHAEAVEARLGPDKVAALRDALEEFRFAVDDELAARSTKDERTRVREDVLGPLLE